MTDESFFDVHVSVPTAAALLAKLRQDTFRTDLLDDPQGVLAQNGVDVTAAFAALITDLPSADEICMLDPNCDSEEVVPFMLFHGNCCGMAIVLMLAQAVQAGQT